MISFPQLSAILSSFACPGAPVRSEQCHIGHIHESHAVTLTDGGAERSVFAQKLNERVFPNIPFLMENIARVCECAGEALRASGTPNPERRALSLVPTRDGRTWLRDNDGAAWRVYRFIADTRCYNKVETVEQARKAAHAFGSFLKLLDQLPADRLHETIPDFHHTPGRVAALETAIREDAAGRASSVRPESEFALDRRGLARGLLDLQEAGLAPMRVAHNDTKLNNVLFDRATDEPVCVVDLDTVMPGLSFNDFGDLVRFACNSTDEDDPQTDRVEFRTDVYEALIRGWLQSAGDVFTPAEIEHLLLAGKVLTYECGIRFLTDHLNGDKYFRTTRPGQNLDRCRTQFRMVQHMENRHPELESIRLRIFNVWKGQQ